MSRASLTPFFATMGGSAIWAMRQRKVCYTRSTRHIVQLQICGCAQTPCGGIAYPPIIRNRKKPLFINSFVRY